jgi:hypothetical protein
VRRDKAALFQRVQAPPGDRSSRKQPEQAWNFEAGFAAGLGLTVIQTCRDDEIDKLHFDIRHLHTLPWKSPEELAEGLNRRIRAVIGAGPDTDEL